jgi:hypothetical protein
MGDCVRKWRRIISVQIINAVGAFLSLEGYQQGDMINKLFVLIFFFKSSTKDV